MRKKRIRLRPFRIMAVFLGVIALVMLSNFPEKTLSIERQQKQLEEAAKSYYSEQSRYNQLTAELAEINTPDFVERTARRLYGYCWYGETVYEVGNLDEIIEAPEFTVEEE